jgi:phenylacetate-CoA ligase
MNPRFKSLYDMLPVAAQNLILSGYSAFLHRQRYGGRFAEFRSLFEESQWYPRERMEEYQRDKLVTLVREAYETVPYYRRLFDGIKLKPSDINSLEDLPKIPLLTRERFKDNFHDLVSGRYDEKRLVKGHTSGTTGSPLEICYDSDTIQATYACLDRQFAWAGCRLERDGDRIAVLRGNIIVPLNRRKPPFWRYNRFHNNLLMSSFHLSPKNLGAYFEELRRFRPKLLDGYPSNMYVLAKHLLNEGRTFPVHAVATSSETLYDFQREAIEKVFECRVFDYYGLAERTIFAAECDRHEGHHLCEEYGITEFLDRNDAPAPAGAMGKMVTTSLFNRAMPLFRYVTNDMTALKPEACSCGRGLRLMEDVTTKAEDILTLGDGRLISSSVLTHPFKPLNAVQESQIIQKDYDHIVVLVVPREDYTEADSRHLIVELQARLGEDMTVEIRKVESIPRTKAGKFKWVVSEVELGI